MLGSWQCDGDESILYMMRSLGGRQYVRTHACSADRALDDYEEL